MIISETKNLRLREFTLHDSPFIIELLNTPGWLQFIGSRNVKSIAEAENYLLNGPMKSYREKGFGLFMVELKSELVSIGMCGLIKRDFMADADIGFAFLPEYFGKGFGYESATATLQYAKEKCAMKKVAAVTSPENKASIALIKKLNMQFEKMITFPMRKRKACCLVWYFN